MKLFTVEEANRTIGEVSVRLDRIARLYKNVESLRENSKAAASASQFGGGMIGGSRYIQALYEMGKLVSEVQSMGIEIKDPASGLIDFPSDRDGRVVYLCWRLGEGSEIAYWHETDAGFAGRQPL